MPQYLTSLALFVGLLSVAAETKALDSGDQEILVECHGKLRHGLVAIGGESTGTTVTFDGLDWELKLSDETSEIFAKGHHKQPVTVTGKLRRVTGTERPARWVVEVTRICEQDTALKSVDATATICGQLHKQDAALGSTATLVISANDITLPVDVSTDAELRAKAESLSTKLVVLKGRIERSSGSGLADRIKIAARSIDLAPGTSGTHR